jgi:hypothetical protein
MERTMAELDDDVQAILDDTEEPLERKVVGLPPLTPPRPGSLSGAPLEALASANGP